MGTNGEQTADFSCPHCGYALDPPRLRCPECGQLPIGAPHRLAAAWLLGVCMLSAGLGYDGVTLLIFSIAYLNDQVYALSVRWLIVQSAVPALYALALGAWIRFRAGIGRHPLWQRMLVAVLVILVPLVPIIRVFGGS